MAKSYMALSTTTLRMLDTFAGDGATAVPFMKQPLLVGGGVGGVLFWGGGVGEVFWGE